MKILELLQYDEAWVKFISASRINGVETDYDLIYDRMADNQANNISEALRKYVEHEISATEVIQKLKWNDSHEADQDCFKTEKALQLLKDRVVIVLKKDKSLVESEQIIKSTATGKAILANDETAAEEKMLEIAALRNNLEEELKYY